jgi:dihydroxy-acid dehydratase
MQASIPANKFVNCDFMNEFKDPTRLRSSRWFAPDDLRSFGHRSRLKGMGLDDSDFRDKPIIGILNTWSDLNTCHSHFPQRVEEVKRGVLQAGGYPVEIPVVSLGEMLMKPTTMLYRNLLALETEEVLRSHPLDAAVLMGGCDKTVPGLLMGAFSADIPTIFLPAGPMLKARWNDKTLGSGSDAWKYWDLRRAGELPDCDWQSIENCIARSAGTCMTMGTASTMACIAEVMGLTLPKASSIPSVVAEHSRLAVATGRRAVELAWQNIKPSQIVSQASLINAVITQLAIGGSTNAIVHIIAMAGRAGCRITLDDFDQWSQRVPVLADLRPAGRFLMEDFHDAGGLPGLLKRLGELLDQQCLTVNGCNLGQQIAAASVISDEVIRTVENPLSNTGGTYVLRGNLAPNGCVIKPVAAEPRLLKHRGRAIVFENYAELKSQINQPDLPVTADSVIVLKSAGPLGAPGFPEWGMLPIPDKLLRAGVRDMVRISDARMSGTSYGTCVLHVSPESHVGGPLALVRNDDEIELDVAARRLELLVSASELQQRRAQWRAPEPSSTRGYAALFAKHVTQAHEGCDFDFLQGRSPGSEPAIF